MSARTLTPTARIRDIGFIRGKEPNRISAIVTELLGLRHPGIAVADPGCVAKTYPSFFTDFERLSAS